MEFIPLLMEFFKHLMEFLIIPLSLSGMVLGLAILCMCIGG